MSPIRMTEPLNPHVLWLDAEKQEYMGHERKGARFVLKFTVGTKRTSEFLAYLLKNLPYDGLYLNCSISPRRKKTVTVCLTYNGLQSLAKALEHLPRVGFRLEKTLDRALFLLAKKRKSASKLLEIPDLPQELRAKIISWAL